MNNRYTVRRADRHDATAFLALMRELARFEGYLDQFRVSENDLLERGLGIGRALMAAVMVDGTTQGCARLKWDVLPGNVHAQAF